MICDMSRGSATLESKADERISIAVWGLLAQSRASAGRVAAAAGMSRATLYRKLANESSWQAAEVDRLAGFFGVTRDSIFEGRAEWSKDAATLAVSAPLAQLAEQLTLNQRVRRLRRLPETAPGRVVVLPDRRRQDTRVSPAPLRLARSENTVEWPAEMVA